MLTKITESSGGFHSVLSMLSLIFIFALIIALAYFATRFIAKYQSNMLNGKSNIRVLESYRVGSNKFIAIVKIGNSYYAVGIGKDELTMIDKINPDELTDFHAVADSGDKPAFKEILAQVRRKSKKADDAKDKNEIK